MKVKIWIMLSLFLFMNGLCYTQQKNVSISFDKSIPQIKFAVEELSKSFAKKNIKIVHARDKINNAVHVDFTLDPALGEESYKIISENNKLVIKGGDAAGLMYGGLALAERVIIEKNILQIGNLEERPYMKKRGVKFNIPLDVRTPSYSDLSDAAQKNIAEMWNFNFWKNAIDLLAKYRYNMISLWSLHPFPSLVKVPEYPDIALNDVKISTGKFKEYYDRRGTGFDSPEVMNSTKTILKISIDEKIEFWKKVMRYAKERNIDLYIITWNLFTYGTEGKYGITTEIGNEKTKDYFRKSVKQLFLTYPDLAGIGITTGENLGTPGGSFEEKENWVFDTYAQGVLDALKEQPDRKITFIHRQHESAATYIAKKFMPLINNKNINFSYSFKYSHAHVFSSTTQDRHQNFIKEIEGYKTFWTLRNDDNFYFRWGAPDFVREFIKNIPYEISNGFYYGSDNYIWGREFLSKNPNSPRQLEFEKHWYHWMLWGRLGYNPNLSNEFIKEIIQARFPKADAVKLFSAWQNASMIYPVTTGFHWGNLDYKWYIEGCRSAPDPAQTATGFHDVNRFITLPPHPKTNYQSIPDYVKMVDKNESSDKLTPFAVSDLLHNHADSALGLTRKINSGGNKELGNTLHDIMTMAYLGKYYAYKIAGAARLALYREFKKTEDQTEAVNQLTKALEYWNLYSQSAMKQYKNPLWTNRVGYVDWVKQTEEVKKDIDIARLTL